MLDRHAGLPQPNLLHEFDLIGLIRAGIPGRMTRTLAAAVLLVSVGCSNAPIAGSLDAIWPARGGPPAASGGNGNPGRLPIVPDVRPPGPDARPAAPPATDALPPPADFVPSGGPKE
jgi:hypothetical protein